MKPLVKEVCLVISAMVNIAGQRTKLLICQIVALRSDSAMTRIINPPTIVNFARFNALKSTILKQDNKRKRNERSKQNTWKQIANIAFIKDKVNAEQNRYSSYNDSDTQPPIIRLEGRLDIIKQTQLFNMSQTLFKAPMGNYPWQGKQYPSQQTCAEKYLNIVGLNRTSDTQQQQTSQHKSRDIQIQFRNMVCLHIDPLRWKRCMNQTIP